MGFAGIAVAVALAGTAAVGGGTGFPPGMVVRSALIKVTGHEFRGLCAERNDSSPADLSLRLFPGVLIEAAADEITADGGSLHWQGHLLAQPDDTVDLVVDGACGHARNVVLTGDISQGRLEYDLEPDGTGLVRVDEIDLTRLPAPDPGTMSPQMAAGPSHARLIRAGAPAAFPVVDVLVGYTPAALARVGGHAQMDAQLALTQDLANQALAQSGVHGAFRFVKTIELAGYTGTELTSPVLKRMTDRGDPFFGPGGRYDLAALRDRHGASLVAVITDAWGKTSATPSGTGIEPSQAGTVWAAEHAYMSAEDVQALTSLYVFSHEAGHNFGLLHDWTVSPGPSQNYPGAHANFSATGGWRTIMSYPDGCRQCSLLNRYSNAADTYNGVPMGVRPGSSDTSQSSSQAAVLNSNFPLVAAYRPHKTPLVYHTVTVTAAAGGTATASDPGPFPAGSAVSVYAVPRRGFVFTGWRVNGKPGGGANPAAFVVSQDHRIQAEFKRGDTPRARLTIPVPHGWFSDSPGKVTWTPAGTSFITGAQITLSATSKYHNARFACWYIDGQPAGGDGSRLDLTMDTPHTLVAAFINPNVPVKGTNDPATFAPSR